MWLLDALLGAAVPPVCTSCGRPLVAGERMICTACVLKFARRNPLEDAGGELRLRIHLRTNLIRMMGAWAVYSHDAPVAELIRRGKYGSQPALIRRLAAQMAADFAARADLSYIDLIMPMPMHWRKRLTRGYNQARIIAEELGQAIGAPVAGNLVATRPHKTQTRESASVRINALKGTMRLERPDEITGRHIALVDDIITTGGTLTAAVEEIVQAAPASITILTLAASV